jgi:hypothetical protein
LLPELIQSPGDIPITTVGASKEAQSTVGLDHGALVGLEINKPSAPSATNLL